MIRSLFKRAMAASCLAGVSLSAGLTAAQAEPVAQATPQATAPAPAAAVARIPLYVSDGRALLMMRINGGHPAPVVFDTGTNGNLIYKSYADDIGMPNVGPSQSRDGSTGLMVPGYTTSLKGVTLGGYAITEGPATVFEFRDEDEVGIFGPNSFPGKLVEMNLAKGELRIMAPDAPQRPEGPGHAYSDDERLPVVALDLPGASVEATLDTGNDSAFLLPLSLVSQIKLKGEPRKIGIATSAAGTQPVYEAQADGPVKVGGVVVDSPKLRFIEGGTPNIGLPMMRKFRFVFDPTNERTWVLAGD